ncbi:ABC transporter substrate-binding protein [Xanthobacter dioxanivorans]|uniref:ABC transporter substrate-binding protein n=1 Tax=Xanthobacter dioxanivorans TaxID=2528964 RepID=A0A974PSI6_9HYPH|nr:ABC transporter substrate-binding protein [Xanthobacter dioxanivorans]QRG08983.1 ABC transporter substrate-binding protein [Xanthobacter dioxanivorans]
MNRRELIAGIAGLSLAAAGRAQAQAVPEVTIGTIYPLTGASAQVGFDAKLAVETALDVVNTVHDLDLPTARNAGLAGLGGAKVRVVFADHQGDPQKGRAEAERLITQEKVSAIFGTYHSSVATTVSTTADRYQVPFLAADSSSPTLQRRKLRYFFRAMADDEQFSKVMFDFLDAERKGGRAVEKIALFHEDTIFGTDSSNIQRQLAESRGYRIVADIKYRANSPSLTSEVQQLKAAQPDVLLPSSYTTDAILLIKTMNDLGFQPPAMIAQAAGFVDKALYDAVGDKVDGLITRAEFSLDLAQRRPMIAKINDLYRARSGKDMNENTSREFMAVILLADAIDRARSTSGPAVRDALAATDLPGDRTIMPWKYVKFGPDGQNTGLNPVLLQYIDGRFATIFPPDVAVRPVKWPMR